MVRRYACMLAVAAGLLLGLATVSRSKGLRGKKPQGVSRIPSLFREEERIAMKEALKGAIQIPTVSFSDEESNTTALAEFGEYMQKVFPTLFNTSFIQHEVVGEYSHLFTVQGSDPTLQPYMLMAHFDVVPAPGEGWDVPPFSGLERDGFIHGRGTLDNKNSVMAILQALKLLLIRNYIPQRSFFIALGHDEEVSGKNGAQKISTLLQARGVQLAFIVDEGSFILDGFVPNLKKPFAQIAVSEKGAVNLMLEVNMTPGHSSAPPKETSIGILAAAVSRLEQTPMPNMFGEGPLKIALEQLGNEVDGEKLHHQCDDKDHHSTHHVQCRGQGKCNTPKGPGHNQLPDSPCTDCPGGTYYMFRQLVQHQGGTCIGNTDSRHYTNLSTSIYRFNPLYLQPQDFSSIHGINEKISVQAYETQVKFIFELIQNADIFQAQAPHWHEL
ncbi:N-fatty-acyl-amino acid synthase/hydrolase PM20D1 isoform X5 [Choloepus didactylus]|uniref:N-fatty-acyl-amino acid synthase/hydrolase PM20D1 isoform X5 n=1 Tax=Choloepus didactylus TaxID=27675 RepID=UPI00189D030B|nr:N-fatty-acyl-amino acid synthase/hydrolase PM20D1 isoform X5 [Choloepus didactylus]